MNGIIERHTELKVKRFPILVTYRKHPDSKERQPFYWNLYTGKKSFDLDAVKEKGILYQIFDKTSSEMYGVSIQYDAKKKLIAFIYCKIDTHCSADRKTESPRKWEPMDISYYSKDKKYYVCTSSKMQLYSTYYETNYIALNKKIYMQESPIGFSAMYSCHLSKRCVLINSPELKCDTNGNKYWDAYDLMKPFRDWYGEIVPISGNKMIVLDCIEALVTFSRYKTPSGKTYAKKNQRLQELLQYELPEVTIPENFEELNVLHDWHLRNSSFYATNANIHKFAVIQKVNGTTEPFCVLRSFYKSPYENTIVESGRIYVSQTEIISCKKRDENNFMYQKLLEKPENWNFPIENFDKKETIGTRLEYFGEILDEIDYKNRGIAIWSFFKYPIVEMLLKTPDFKPIMEVILKVAVVDSPRFLLKQVFGNINDKEKTIYKILGMNKYQVEKILPLTKKYMPHFSYWSWLTNGNSSPVVLFKTLLKWHVVNPDEANNEFFSIADIDNETTDWAISVVSLVLEKRKTYSLKTLQKEGFIDDYSTAYKIYNKYKGNDDVIIDCLETTIQIYGIGVAKKVKDSLFKFKNELVLATHFHPFFGYEENYMAMTTVYYDFISMVKYCNYQTRIKPYFNSLEELASMHDMMVETVNSIKSEIESKKWNERVPKWKKWEFKDENFSAIIPESPKDLATEGITLHHCVKTYIQRVADGVTNIMFIRKNDEIDKPFYTVEVDNNGIIQQVHGFCNCNATTEIQDFVKKWCKNKKLRTLNYNKVR